MRFVYLVISHTNPEQVARLLRTLRRSSPASEIVVHHDTSKSNFTPPAEARARVIENPVAVEWGDFSQVDMCLHALRWVKEHVTFDWLVMISGQDYPVQPLHEFERRLATSGQDAFVKHFDLERNSPWPPGHADWRYSYAYFRLPRFAYYYRLPEALKQRLNAAKQAFNVSQRMLYIQTSPRNIATKLGLRRRSTPFGETLRCYGGSDWFNLSAKAVHAILDFVDRRPDVVNHYRRTFLPSESFVHTVLLNDPDLRVGNDHCRFLNWVGENPTSPQIIRMEDIERVIASGQPFARKFDARVDSEVLDWLDARLIPQAAPARA